jgi:phage baseplate assembly protein W
MSNTTLSNIYCDLDLTFNKRPGSKDVSLSFDDQAVIRSLRGLLLTDYYERLFQPGVGSGLAQLLFEPMSPTTTTSIQTLIQQTITNYEPRVKIQSVVVTENSQQNGYNVTITFFIGNATQATSINFLLQRTR